MVIKRVNVEGGVHLIIDVALIYEFDGNHMGDVSRNGALRNALIMPSLLSSSRRPRGLKCSATARPLPSGGISPTPFCLV